MTRPHEDLTRHTATHHRLRLVPVIAFAAPSWWAIALVNSEREDRALAGVALVRERSSNKLAPALQKLREA